MSANRTDAIQIARRYATAIFAQALEGAKENTVVGEINTLAQAIDGSAELRAALKNPLVSRGEKANVLAALVQSGDGLTVQSVKTLAEGGRAELVPAVAKALQEKLNAHHGELVAVITSARPLAANVQKQLKQTLEKATGKAIQLELTQDPNVLGGLAVQLGSLRLDATLAGALNSMRTQMTAAAAQQ